MQDGFSLHSCPCTTVSILLQLTVLGLGSVNIGELEKRIRKRTEQRLRLRKNQSLGSVPWFLFDRCPNICLLWDQFREAACCLFESSLSVESGPKLPRTRSMPQQMSSAADYRAGVDIFKLHSGCSLADSSRDSLTFKILRLPATEAEDFGLDDFSCAPNSLSLCSSILACVWCTREFILRLIRFSLLARNPVLQISQL